MQGTPVEVKFGTKTNTLYVHPDGVIVGNSTQLQLQFERAQRARKRVEQIRRKLAGGEMSGEQWQEAQRKLDEQMKEGMDNLDAKLAGGEIEKKEFDDTKRSNEIFYRTQVDFLLNQRDGEPVSLDEEDKLSSELEVWLQRASFKPFAVPMLKSCLLSWTLNKADENGRATDEPLPLTYDDLNSLPEDFIIVAFMAVNNHYKEDEAEEKKPTETLQLLSVTTTAHSAESLNGFRSLELPEPTELTPARSQSGDSESLAAPGLN
jgi:hypothetical protein